nr:hypothetical protein [Tanacetum cinerariifolium]
MLVGGENKGEQDQDRSVFGSNSRNKDITKIERNECDCFDGNLSGDQFPPISAQKRNKNDVDLKDCLDTNARGIEKGFSTCGEDDGEESNGGVWNMRFVDIVSSNLIDNKLEVITTELGADGNEVVVVLNDEMIELGCEKWKYTVCGFFVGGYVTYNEARYHLRRMWNKYGFIDILKNDGEVFFFKFQDEKEPSKLPIWVKILNVPMKDWSLKRINSLASCLGKPIIIDDMTAKMCAKGEGRLIFARVLIEIDARKELKKEIEVVYKGNKCHEKFNKRIQMEYAWKPPCCDICKVFGHDNKGCRLKENEVNVELNEDVMMNAEKPFTVVHNRRVNFTRENQNKNKWNGNNGYNGINANGRYYGAQNRYYTRNGNNERCDYRKKHDTTKGSTSDSDNRDEIHKTQNEEVRDKSGIGNQGWSKEMERYFRDRKELSDAAKDMEQNEDVKLTICKKVRFFCTMVYASNSYTERRKLWKDLGSQKIITNGEPWVTLGDFNVTMNVEENSNGSLIPSNKTNEFSECLKCKTLKKLDRILINEAFMDKFQTANGMFLPYLISDHSPAILRVVKMLKLMKPCMKKLSWKDGNIFERVTKLIKCLKNIRAEVDKYPHNEDIKVKSCKILSENYKAMKDENNLLMQKAKIEWLKDGDRNTEFFHKIIKGRMHKGKIVFVCNEKGERFENDQIVEQFVKHFQEFLVTKDVVTEIAKDIIVFPNKLSFEESVKMCKDVSDAEVKNAMFDIKDSKALGPDVNDFFVNGKLLGEVNANLISLVPKVPNPDRDFLRVILEQFGFPKKMVKWIMVCVSTTKFFININEEREGYFSGGRGLRQEAEQKSILDIFPFAIERLPVRYLRVPSLTKKINATDCKPLVEKVKDKVLDRRNKTLSYRFCE